MKIVLTGDHEPLADELRAEHVGVTFTVATNQAEQLEQLADADAMYGWRRGRPSSLRKSCAGSSAPAPGSTRSLTCPSWWTATSC